MSNRYYQDELENLRELSRDFAQLHPALAPMLSGPAADPDVERLLEGVAFLTGLLRSKLDDDFPEIIHGLMDLVFPHYLRPLPSSSVVVFTPKPAMREIVQVPAGTSLASANVDGTECLFRTCFDLQVHPIQLKNVELEPHEGQQQRLRLSLQLNGPTLSQWKPASLMLYLGDSFELAADWFWILTRCVSGIRLIPAEAGQSCSLPPDALRPYGFDLGRGLLPVENNVFRGYRLLQEYFLLPQKFLFLELTGWEQWKDRGNGKDFDLVFDLQSGTVPPAVTNVTMMLFATPVINLFKQEAEPILLDHRAERVRVRPSSKSAGHYQIYSVDQVVGHTQGRVTRRNYSPLNLSSRQSRDETVYQVIRGRSPVTQAPEVFLTFAYPHDGSALTVETLSVELTCTNGNLPEKLRLGDICRQTADSPELLTFRNILPPTATIEPPLGKNALWRLLSHLSLNFLPMANAGNLKDLLQLYCASGRDRARTEANLKRLDGVVEFRTKPAKQLQRGLLVCGQTLELTARQDCFAGRGDLYLFASVLDLFLSVYSSLNSYTQLQLTESISGERFSWPARWGERQLI